MTQPAKRLAAPSAPSPSPAEPDDDPFALAAPDYDPAEYRWVPVRRRPRYDGWTEEKQRRFIEVLADSGLVGLAAQDHLDVVRQHVLAQPLDLRLESRPTPWFPMLLGGSVAALMTLATPLKPSAAL